MKTIKDKDKVSKVSKDKEKFLDEDNLKTLTLNEVAQLYTQAAYQKQLRLARESYRGFLHFILGDKYMESAHTRLLCDYLERVEKGEITNLIISMPPRHGKSVHVSKYFPAWYLGRNPTNEIIITSYGATLAQKTMSAPARDTFREFGPEVFGVNLSKEKRGEERWEVETYYGGCSATGVGGSLIGRGASLIIVDDPIKDMHEARSKAVKDSLEEWYDGVLRTRGTPDVAVIIVATRFACDDLIGRLLERAKTNPDAEQWEYLCLPAVCNSEDDMLGRAIGEPLWPEYYPLKKLKPFQINPIIWASEFQQSPIPFKDLVFEKEWLRTFKAEEVVFNRTDACYYFRGSPIVKRIASLDPAKGEDTITSKKCYTAIVVVDVTRNKDILIRHILREKINIPKQYECVVMINEIFKPNIFLLESVGYQECLASTLILTGKFIPMVLVPRSTKIHKIDRICDLSPYFQMGKIYVENVHEKVLREEYDLFPTGRYFDVMDALEMAVTHVRQGIHKGDMGVGGIQEWIADMDVPDDRCQWVRDRYVFEDGVYGGVGVGDGDDGEGDGGRSGFMF